MNIRLKNLKDRLWVTILPIVVGILILVVKFYAYSITDSQAIFSDALESIINVLASLATLTVVIIAAKPADEDHPYGHGKAESMAATFEGSAISLAGLVIIFEAAKALFTDHPLQALELGLILTAGAGLGNGLMGAILLMKGKKLHSEALRSSGAHLLTDALTSVGVLISLVLVKWTGKTWIDPVVGALFGCALTYAGLKILIRSGNVLLDGHDQKLLQKLVGLFEKHRRPGVIHIHHTRVIRSGNFHHIECHVVVPEYWTIAESHDFSEKFEEDIIQDYPVNGELRMHLDPCRRVYCKNCEMSDCPIREAAFVQRYPLTLEIITAPEETV